jgi:CheY-like chemotaxis protein
VAERERELVHGREREYEQLLGELRAALAREQQSREEVGAGAGAGAGDGREEIERALEAARGAEGAALADAEAARATLASQQAIVEALEEEARQAHLEIERLTTAEETERSLRGRIEVELTEARTREESAQARLTDAVREAEALRTERDRLAVAGREQQAETVRLVARLESFTAERDRLSEGLAALAAERDRIAAEGGDAAAARARLEEALARETNERARLAEALTAAQAALGELETVQVEATARAAEIERLTAERDRALVERDAALAQIPAAKPTAPVPAPAHEPVRVVTVTPAHTPRTRVRSVEPGRRLVAVLDADASWESAAVEGHEVEVFTPCEDVVARLGAAAPARLMVNLLVPGALGIVTALRSAGTGARVWGCIADAAADRALPLGMIEPATRPLDPDAVLALLGAYATRGTRLVTAGTDVDALMSLRQALARRGISVSMAWDAKQAVELFGVVRPEVVLVDLALPRRDGYGIVAKLGTIDPIPSAIILPGTDDGTNFAAVLADPLRARHVVPVERLLADVVQRSEAAPVDRRQKVRAIGRK